MAKDIEIVAECDAPPPEMEKPFVEGFYEVARRSGAVGARIDVRSDKKKWRCVASFSNDDKGKALSIAFRKQMLAKVFEKGAGQA
jgi:hypothetical protein